MLRLVRLVNQSNTLCFRALGYSREDNMLFLLARLCIIMQVADCKLYPCEQVL